MKHISPKIWKTTWNDSLNEFCWNWNLRTTCTHLYSPSALEELDTWKCENQTNLNFSFFLCGQINLVKMWFRKDFRFFRKDQHFGHHNISLQILPSEKIWIFSIRDLNKIQVRAAPAAGFLKDGFYFPYYHEVYRLYSILQVIVENST